MAKFPSLCGPDSITENASVSVERNVKRLVCLAPARGK
jgi:hypothetical protein